MNITILGAGAIGSLWACHLADAGHNVSIWSHKPEKSDVSITLDDKNPNRFITNSVLQLKSADVILVTVKAWQVKGSISPLLNHLTQETIIVFMHNGMGVIEELPSTTDKHPVVLATTTHGAFKPDKHNVHHTGLGSTTLGGYNHLGHQCQFLSDVFDHALPSAHWSDSINTALWNKLAISCVINPLTAIYQCLNGDLLQEKFSTNVVQLVGEVSTVMKAENIEVCSEALLSTVHQVISATAKNHSSMQQDIQYKRATEIGYITGYLCKVAQRHGINVPTNQDLYSRIKTIEQSWS